MSIACTASKTAMPIAKMMRKMTMSALLFGRQTYVAVQQFVKDVMPRAACGMGMPDMRAQIRGR
jgi:hypothetical protein